MSAENNIKALFISLREKGVKNIHIEYAGSGDSGAIDSIDVFEGDYNLTHEEYQSVEDFAYSILDNYEYDWYNNEGGYGTVKIDLDEMTWEIDGYIYEYKSIPAGDEGDLVEFIDEIFKK